MKCQCRTAFSLPLINLALWAHLGHFPRHDREKLQDFVTFCKSDSSYNLYWLDASVYVTLTCCDIFHNRAMLWKCGYLCSWDCAPYTVLVQKKRSQLLSLSEIYCTLNIIGVFPNETHCKHSETDLILISLFSQPKLGETKNLKRKRWHTL